jgi:drug/metabolite transporter (DMT)-like permease
MPTTHMNTKLQFLLAPLLFASNMVAARWIGGELPPTTLAFGRWLIAALILLPFILPALKAHAAVLRARKADLILLAILGGVLSVAPQYAAARYTSAGHIALIFALTPILVSFIDRIVWHAALPAPVMLGATIAFTGIGIVVFEGNPANILHSQFNPGDIIAGVSALAWAGYSALLKRRPVHIPPLLMLWVVCAGGAVGLFFCVPIEWLAIGAIPTLTVKGFTGMLFVALVAGIAAYIVYGNIVSRLGAAKASMAMYLVPVYAFLMGAALLGETLHTYHLVATLLVFAGVACATLKPQLRLVSEKFAQ